MKIWDDNKTDSKAIQSNGVTVSSGCDSTAYEHHDGKKWVPGPLPTAWNAPLFTELEADSDNEFSAVISEDPDDAGTAKPRYACHVKADGHWAFGCYDTGSEAVLVSSKYVKAHFPSYMPKPTNVSIKPVGPTSMSSEGTIRLKLSLGDQPGRVAQMHTCYITQDLGCDFLIGRSLTEQLKKHCSNVVLNESDLYLSYLNAEKQMIKVKLWPWREASVRPGRCAAVTANKVTLGPGEARLVPLQLMRGSYADDSNAMILEPHAKASNYHGIHMTRAVDYPDKQGCLRILCANDKNHQVEIPQGISLATAELTNCRVEIQHRRENKSPTVPSQKDDALGTLLDSFHLFRQGQAVSLSELVQSCRMLGLHQGPRAAMVNALEGTFPPPTPTVVTLDDPACAKSPNQAGSVASQQNPVLVAKSTMREQERKWGLPTNPTGEKSTVAVHPPVPQAAEALSLSEILTALRERHPHLLPTDWEALEQLLREFTDIISTGPNDFGRTTLVEHQVDLEGDFKPYHRQYQIPHRTREAFALQLQAMLKAGVIEPCVSPWGSPVVIASRKDGRIRVCVDFRYLNSFSTDDPYMIPRAEEMFNKLQGAQYITTLDLTAGYWQVPLREADRYKTAFVCPQGQFQYTVMPFGLKNAPATFQRLMDTVLRSCHEKVQAMVYLDDVIIYSHSAKDHMNYLRDVFDAFREAGLKIRTEKCKFLTAATEFLGHWVDGTGKAVLPDKVQQLRDRPPPKNAKEVKEFLGGVGYYQEFIPNYSVMTYPIRRLLRKTTNFCWDDKAQRAFDQIKVALTTAPVLRYPNFNHPFKLYTDGSKRGLGAVLCQDFSDGEHPIAYASRATNDHEACYGPTHLEATAVVWAIEHFRYYLLGSPFTITSDHQALKFIFSPTGRLENLPDKMKRWILRLQPFVYQLEFRPGAQMGHADMLSRPPSASLDKVQSSVVLTNVGNTPGKPDSSSSDAEIALPTLAHIAPPEAGVPTVTSKVVQTQSVTVNAVRGRDTRTVPGVGAPLLSGSDEIRRWAQAQQNDPFCQALRQYIDDGTFPPDTSHSWKTAIRRKASTVELYKHLLVLTPDQSKSQPRLRLIIPDSMFDIIFDHLHWINHSGVHRTYLAMSAWYFITAMDSRIRDRIGKCTVCQQAKVRSAISLEHHQYFANHPFELVFADWLHMEPTTDGYRYALIFQDHFTKWAEVYPAREMTSETTGNILARFVCAHGIPKFLFTDQGSNFRSVATTALLRACGISHVMSIPHHHQSHGLIERFNRTFREMIRVQTVARAAKQLPERTWVDLTPLVLFIYHNSVHETTGFTPYFLNHGTEARREILPFDMNVDDDCHVEQWVQDRVYDLTSAFDTIRRRNADLAKRRLDVEAAEARVVHVRDLVFVKTPHKPGIPGKQQPVWVGPMQIVKQHHPNYVVVPFQPEGYTETERASVHHITQLRPAHTSWTTAMPLPPDLHTWEMCLYCKRINPIGKSHGTGVLVQCENCSGHIHVECVKQTVQQLQQPDSSFLCQWCTALAQVTDDRQDWDWSVVPQPPSLPAITPSDVQRARTDSDRTITAPAAVVPNQAQPASSESQFSAEFPLSYPSSSDHQDDHQRGSVQKRYQKRKDRDALVAPQSQPKQAGQVVLRRVMIAPKLQQSTDSDTSQKAGTDPDQDPDNDPAVSPVSGAGDPVPLVPPLFEEDSSDSA
jgi:hypothetical protein